MTCLHCGATTTNGLALCELCQRKVRLDLEYLPVYFRNLARWRRPGRPNGASGAAGQWLIQQGETDTESIGRALDRAGNDVTTWARTLADDRAIEPPDGDTEAETITALCVWLDEHLTTIATLEWGSQFIRDMDRHEKALLTLTESYVPGWYAGACRQCSHPTHVVPGLTWVTCGACGATTYARDHLDTVLDEARAWVAPPMRLAEAIVALVDTEQSVPRLHKRISKWGETRTIKRKRKDESGETVTVTTTIPPRIGALRRRDAEGDEVGPKRYRLGDVMDLLLSDGATRLTADVGDTAAAS